MPNEHDAAGNVWPANCMDPSLVTSSTLSRILLSVALPAFGARRGTNDMEIT